MSRTFTISITRQQDWQSRILLAVLLASVFAGPFANLLFGSYGLAVGNSGLTNGDTAVIDFGFLRSGALYWSHTPGEQGVRGYYQANRARSVNNSTFP